MTDALKILLPATIGFFVGISITPYVSAYLYKHKLWKKKSGKIDHQGNATEIFNKLHEHKEVGTPRMGGIIIWFSTLFTILCISFLTHAMPNLIGNRFDILSREQTWIPLCALLFGAIVGLLDDIYEIKGSISGKNGGLPLRKRLAFVSIVGLLCGWWFWYKLDVVTASIPFIGTIHLGWLIIILFIIVMLAVYSGGIIDGIDGLAGGVYAIMFGGYSVIAFFQHQVDIAAFCALIVGSILAFLWFNIPPARFYMSETGSMSLGITLTIIAFMTDTLGDGRGLAVLPLVALPLFITSLSSIFQMLSKKFRNKKLFLVAPLHHHFEALGWPAYKVTMRYWVFSVICALLGVVLAIS